MKRATGILILTLAVILAACRDTDGPEEVNPTVYDIVCLRSMDDSGSVFTMTKPDDNRIITYTAREHIDTTVVHVGDRLLLAYRPKSGRPYESGQIQARGYSTVYNDRLRIGQIDRIEEWDRDPVYMLSAWMSENYLNLRARLTYDTKPRTFLVMVDSATIDRERPVCYLIHRMAEPTVNFERATYMSIDMSSLRKLDGCRGFELRLNDSNMDTDILSFDLKDLEN